MPSITLPDGNQKHFDAPVTVHEVASAIGPGLAKAALAGTVDGREVDTSFRIENDCSLAIITARDDAGLEIIRHSTAHLLAHAVKALFPEAQVTIGPVIEDGFYYDFAYERSFTPEDLELIENKMTELANAAIGVERSVLPRDEAVTFFRDMGEEYKAEIIASIPTTDDISVLARGFAKRDAATHLRHSLGRQEIAQAIFASPCGGREARSSQTRAATGPFSLPGRSARDGVLAREGLEAVPAS